jgi:hypothetical protein
MIDNQVKLVFGVTGFLFLIVAILMYKSVSGSINQDKRVTNICEERNLQTKIVGIRNRNLRWCIDPSTGIAYDPDTLSRLD